MPLDFLDRNEGIVPRLNEKPAFGMWIAKLRKKAGYTQVSLAKEIGVSQRVIAYYENETTHPPTPELLPKFASAFGISIEELLNVEVELDVKPKNSSLARKLAEIEKLPAARKKQVLAFIDAILENEELKKQAG